MSRVKSITKHTKNKFLNLFELEAERRDGRIAPYYLSSRAKDIEHLKITTRDNKPDGVIIYGVYGEQKDKVALVRQYRYPIDDYIYEFPAGLVEEGEDMIAAGIREMHEETGLKLIPLESKEGYSKPFFTTIGMTDESCSLLFGYLSGEPTNRYQEASEDIEVILADREECKRIIKEENVAVMCAYMLMHFINSKEEPFEFLI
ncbi:MAG: NUDIX hydrolase [Velocimicrobium sp.]